MYAYRPDALTVWENPEVRRRLSHYRAVMEGERPPLYRAAKRFAVDYDPRWGLEELLDVHEEAAEGFKEHYTEVAEGRPLGRETGKSYLSLKVEIAGRLVDPCRLCEWRCGARRKRGERGVCGLDARVRVASAFLHWGEEAPLVPSGTIFFTGCSFRCVYCQNWDISMRPENGVEVSPQELAAIAVKLYLRGARNINYVGGNPDQSLHVILESLLYMDVDIPLLWNSNMYMTPEALTLILDVIDIWLPDFKYGNNRCAKRLSGVNRYFDVVSRNHAAICRVGDVIVRHLVLPGHLECCTKPVLLWLSENCPRALVNIMDQYRPEHIVARFPERWPELARRPSPAEIEEARRYADELGICWRPVS